MTIININFNAAQVCKIRSTDTLSQVCLAICSRITDHFAYGMLRQDPIRRNQVETACTMIQWYIGVLARACPQDREYDGPPIIQLIYLDKSIVGQDYPTRHAFNLGTLEGVPPGLLTEVLHRVVTTTMGCIACRVITVSHQKVEEWVTKVIGLLNDIHRAIDPDPERSRDGLETLILRYLVCNDNRVIWDFI